LDLVARGVLSRLAGHDICLILSPQVCAGLGGTIREIDLGSNALVGQFSEVISPLAEHCGVGLRLLGLQDNQLHGPVTPSISGLLKLETLWLWGNGLSGELPSTIGQLTSLRMLQLSMNSFSGRPPQQLWQLSRLESLTLDNNNFTGELSESVGQLVALKQLYVRRPLLPRSTCPCSARVFHPPSALLLVVRFC